MPTRKTDTPKLEPLYSVEEAAVLLLNLKNEAGEQGQQSKEAGQRWLRDGVNHKGFPHYRVGRRLMFSERDLVAILEDFCRVPGTYRRARRAARKPVATAA
ncbi:helix-turn-helix domain-containing protein [Streptomyces sp. H27-H5]|uniref:helix-turn-helix domain-containing protein n=1 Tax=Streptomyces sp. H27-H5 TaxID=2996460 RepID=UPI002270118E|nr:helix-turn-helix domain-containing protein [Streptomyces sp. H27-H5]MCY0962457.1 helix-turn-helix domain-containing protein [Streptomyces sp. H27-H5]